MEDLDVALTAYLIACATDCSDAYRAAAHALAHAVQGSPARYRPETPRGVRLVVDNTTGRAA